MQTDITYQTGTAFRMCVRGFGVNACISSNSWKPQNKYNSCIGEKEETNLLTAQKPRPCISQWARITPVCLINHLFQLHKRNQIFLIRFSSTFFFVWKLIWELICSPLSIVIILFFLNLQNHSVKLSTSR